MRKNRLVTIIAQDPSIRVQGKILTAKVSIPEENLLPGPRGHRIHVVDYDSTTKTFYQPSLISDHDPFISASNAQLLNNPAFHAQNVYAIITRILGCFESALGRRIPWSFGGHQIKVAPHAFSDVNAFYSRKSEALLFGYFPSRNKGKQVFTCLSHDVIVHETTHALLDGIRPRLTDPSAPDQAAFHEGFADIISLLSVFSLPEIVDVALDRKPHQGRWQLRKSLLLAIAKEIGQEIHESPARALRQPALLHPFRIWRQQQEFLIPHRRGEILVSAFLQAFLKSWEQRVQNLSGIRNHFPQRNRVIEEGASIASLFLTSFIRSLDYLPPVNLLFEDVLTALLTAHYESFPQDPPLLVRHSLREGFKAFGIYPVLFPESREPGLQPVFQKDLDYSSTHFESMQKNREEVHRFLWQNRQALNLHEHSHLQVDSVNPMVRPGSDGFTRQEIVAVYVESLAVQAGELFWFQPQIPKPTEMPDTLTVNLTGGGTLIFNEHGKVKYHIRSPLTEPSRQRLILSYLWKTGHYSA